MRFILILVALLGLTPALFGQTAPDAVDFLRLAEAFRLARTVQTRVWPGWDGTPLPVLLVTSEREFLIGSRNVPAVFSRAGYSAFLQTDVWSRPRRFDPTLLATFPAFGPPPIIVIGRAETTRKSSTAWVLTVLHEHFHEYQMSDPQYFSAVEQLGLSGGDQTGMWMLNYPFPYQTAQVADAFAALSRQLASVLKTSSRTDREQFWQRYTEFLDALSEPDRRYLSFQAWQEGIARYIELRAAEVAAEAYSPSLEFRSLPDFQAFSAFAGTMREGILRELESPDLRKQQRVSFYALGAGLALLLDQDGDGWKQRYMTEKFRLRP